jgi:hypothetical protein
MRMPISPRVHGVIDYATVATTAAGEGDDLNEEGPRIARALVCACKLDRFHAKTVRR